MKKILVCLFLSLLLVSCNCPNCHEYPCICDCEYATRKTYSNGGDYFSAATLVGEWQMSGFHDKEYMDGCGLIPKGIVFSKEIVKDRYNESFYRCTMTYSVGNNPQWYESDLGYNYVRRELTFYYIGEYGQWEKFISFTFRNFLFPTLTIQDSFGTYEWNKVR